VPAIKIVQAFLGTMTVLLVALVANRASGHRAAAWGAWIGALYPPLAWMSSFVLSETLYSLVAFANVLLLCPILDGTRDILPQSQGRPWRRLIGAGVVGGLAALTRPAHIFFLALVGMWLLATRRYSWAVLFVLGALITIGPWTMRNYMTYGRPVLIASEGGITFWTGNHPLSPGEGDMAANPAIKLDDLRLRAAYPDLSPEELEPIYYREAFGAIRANPAWWAKLEVRKLFYLWVPIGPSYMLHSRLYRVASWISYGTLLPLGALGFLVLARHRTRPYTLWLLLLSAVLACLTFLPQERFRVPVIDPALIVGAAALLASRDDAQVTASRAVAGRGSS
jgi:hypothetical protein